MKEKKLHSKLRSLNTTEAKVLECVPIADPWNMIKIHQELYRKGVRLNHATVSGCLRTMAEIGVIKEKDHKYYRVVAEETDERVEEMKIINSLANPPAIAPRHAELKEDKKPQEINEVKAEQEAKQVIDQASKATLVIKKTPMATTAATTPSNKVDYMGKLAQHAADLRVRADKLEKEAKLMKEQAEQMENLAIQLGEYEEMIESKLDKAKQMASLLKSFQEE